MIPQATKHIGFLLFLIQNIRVTVKSVHLLVNYYKLFFNPLNAELNPICHLLALLGAHHILHVSGIRVKPIKEEFTKDFALGLWIAPLQDPGSAEVTGARCNQPHNFFVLSYWYAWTMAKFTVCLWGMNLIFIFLFVKKRRFIYWSNRTLSSFIRNHYTAQR